MYSVNVPPPQQRQESRQIKGHSRHRRPSNGVGVWIRAGDAHGWKEEEEEEMACHCLAGEGRGRKRGKTCNLPVVVGERRKENGPPPPPLSFSLFLGCGGNCYQDAQVCGQLDRAAAAGGGGRELGLLDAKKLLRSLNGSAARYFRLSIKL